MSFSFIPETQERLAGTSIAAKKLGAQAQPFRHRADGGTLIGIRVNKLCGFRLCEITAGTDLIGGASA
jgi:hypothetical protein